MRNPLLAETQASRALTPLLFDSLLAHDPDSGQPVPRLAQRWEVSDDTRTITFTLRADARWQDGQPLVADDVAFTLEAARDPALDSLYGPTLRHVAEVFSPDDRMVVIHLNEADCPSLTAVGNVPILPHHLLADSGVLTQPLAIAPLGSGPFIYVNQTAPGEVQLRSNEAYWGGAPYLDTLSYRPFETTDDLQRALEDRQIDVALMPYGDIVDSDAAELPFSVYRYPAGELLFVAFNNSHPLLEDARVRLALSMAIDRQSLLDQTLHGNGELIAASLSPRHWAADPTLQTPPYDPDAARELLLEAGWSDTDGDGWLDRDGERLRLSVRANGGNRLREDVAMLITGYYRAIGIDATVELVIWGAVVDDLFTHDFEAIVFSWPLGPDPDQSQWWLSTQNEMGNGDNFVSFADEQVDRLLKEASAMPLCDPDRRAQLYREVQRLLAKERPYDFLLLPYASVLARPDLRGLAAGPFAGPLESAPAWYIEP
jgi:peptide/nickel transport system substrate-binding protein